MTGAPRTEDEKKISQESREGDSRKDTRRKSVVAFSPLPNSGKEQSINQGTKLWKRTNYLGGQKGLQKEVQ